MFGRSGQMFPRRAYHDAMYEEEYGGGGSDSEEDCCRGRGLAGVLCWFFSVIILIGLAASVILTVFFVLKSRNLMGSSGGGGGVFDDLDLMYGFNHRNKFEKNETATVVEVSSVSPTTRRTSTTTEVTSGEGDPYRDSDFTSSRESQSAESVRWKERKKISPSSPVTVAHPTRRGYGVVNRTSTVATTPTTTPTTTTTWMTPTTSRPTKAPTMTTTTTTTTNAPKQSDAEALNSTTQRRISHFGSVERPPPAGGGIRKDEGSNERWTPIQPGTTHSHPSSSSEENLSTTTHAHVLFSMPPTSHIHNGIPGQNQNRRRPQRGPLPTSFSTSTEKLAPPLAAGQSDQAENSNSTAPPPKAHRGDLLERIIKNLAPKFKNKTEIFSSHERPPPTHPNLRIKTTIRTRTTSPASPPAFDIGFAEEVQASSPATEGTRVGALEVVEPPKFHGSRPPKLDNSSQETGLMSSQEFMDILVGDEDQKRLVTKATGSGIITSVILPSWYVNDTEAQNATADSSGASGGASVEQSSRQNATVPAPDESDLGGMTSSGSSHTIVQRPSPTGLGSLFMDMFDPDHNVQEPNRVGTLTHRPRNPIGPILQEPKRPLTSFKDLLKDLAPVFPPSTFRPQNEYGHVDFQDHTPEEDGVGGHVTSEESDMEEEEPAPSHIIEVAYDGHQRPQIIIEPDGPSEHAQEEDSEATVIHRHVHHHHREPLNSASEPHPQIISPPPHFKVPILQNASNPTPMPRPDPETLEEANVDDNQEDENLQNVYAHRRPILDEKMETEEDLYKNGTGMGQGETFLETSPEVSGEIRLPEDYNNRIQIDRNEDTPSGPHQGSSDFFLHRHPVSELDENLFSQGPSFQIHPPPLVTKPELERAPPKRIPGILHEQPTVVHQVYPMKFSSPSTSAPTSTTTTSTTTLQPMSNQHQNSDPPANFSGFNPPELIDFHSNVHSFKPSVVTTSGFTPLGADTWRPVVYEGEENHYGPAHVHTSSQNHPYVPPQSMGFGNAPSSFEGGSVYGNGGGGSILPAFSQALKLRPTTTGSQFDQSVEASSHWLTNVFTSPKPTAKPPVIPSPPIPPPPMLMSPSRMKFPTAEQDAAAQQVAAAVIDRAKYLHRPAPPPILMRRTPEQRHRPGQHKPLRNPPYLNQQQQIQQQRMLKERLYHQHMTRMRLRPDGGGGLGNIQWPHEEQPIRRNG